MTTITTKCLCAEEDITKSTALRWAKQGCPHEQGSKGLRWNLNAVQIWRAANIRPSTEADPDFLKARARKETALAEKHELDLQVRKKELVNSKEVEHLIFASMRLTRDAFLGLADRLAAPLAAELDAHEVHQLLNTECRRILEDLAKSFRAIKV